MLLPCVWHSLPLAPFYSSLTFHVPALQLQLNKNFSFAPALSSCRRQSSYNVTPPSPPRPESLCEPVQNGVARGPHLLTPSGRSVPGFQKFGLLTWVCEEALISPL